MEPQTRSHTSPAKAKPSRVALTIAGLIALMVGACTPLTTPTSSTEAVPSASRPSALAPASPRVQPSASHPAASSTTLPMTTLSGRIVFTRAGGAYGDETIFTANADGTNERQLTENGVSCCVRVSPDRRSVLYSFPAPDGRRVTTAVEAIADGSVQLLPLPDATANLGPGAWAPDGKRIAVQLWDETDPARDGIYTVGLDGSGLARLTDPDVADIPGDFSPDGSTLIVFRESTTQSVGSLYRVAADGSGSANPISPEGLAVGYGSVRFSPDGSAVLFQEGRTSPTGALWIMNPDGTNARKLFEDDLGRFVSHPAWSPDGSEIMFVLNPVADDFEHRPNGLFVIDADGSNLRQVMGGNDFKREPEWFE